MTYKLKQGYSLVLRTCDAKMQGYGGFQWPAIGKVVAPDWKATVECGNGLHGLLNGRGNGELLDWSRDAKWLVCEVKTDTIVELFGKVKFPECKVIYCGDQFSSTSFLQVIKPDLQGIVGATATAGTRGTATAGDYGTATAGDSGTATAGDYGTATAGDYGTATAGDSGTATAGTRGILSIKWYDGDRDRIAIAYVGENGIKANTPYKLNEKGEFVEVK